MHVQARPLREVLISDAKRVAGSCCVRKHGHNHDPERPCAAVRIIRYARRLVRVSGHERGKVRMLVPPHKPLEERERIRESEARWLDAPAHHGPKQVYVVMAGPVVSCEHDIAPVFVAPPCL